MRCHLCNRKLTTAQFRIFRGAEYLYFCNQTCKDTHRDSKICARCSKLIGIYAWDVDEKDQDLLCIGCADAYRQNEMNFELEIENAKSLRSIAIGIQQIVGYLLNEDTDETYFVGPLNG